MPEEIRLIVIVLAMAAVTYLPRALPLHVNASNWPQWFRDSIEYLPVSIVAAIVVPSLLPNEGHGLLAGYSDLLAAVPTALCAYFTRNLLASVVLGTGTYLLLT